MRVRRHLLCLVAGATAAGAVAGCRSPTQIAVELSTDEPCEIVAAGGVAITVGQRDELEKKSDGPRTSACNGGEIGSIVLVPSGSRDGSLSLRVVLGVHRRAEECLSGEGGVADYGGCIVARRTLRYVPHTPLTLPVALRGACEGKPCPGQTCVQGRCVDATIVDPSRCTDGRACGDDDLGAADAGPPPPPPPPPGDGGFDATAQDASADAQESGAPGLACTAPAPTPSAATGGCRDADSQLNCLLCCEVCRSEGLNYYAGMWPCACSSGLCTTVDCPSATSCTTAPTGLATDCSRCLFLAGGSTCSAATDTCRFSSTCSPFFSCLASCF
jgi:hypothetical protein